LRYDEDTGKIRNSIILSDGRNSALEGHLTLDQTQSPFIIGGALKHENDETMQTVSADKIELEGFMDSPLKFMENTNGDLQQIEAVSDLYASELTQIVNMENLKMDIINMEDDS
jgi:hypothetical protein